MSLNLPLSGEVGSVTVVVTPRPQQDRKPVNPAKPVKVT